MPIACSRSGSRRGPERLLPPHLREVAVGIEPIRAGAQASAPDGPGVGGHLGVVLPERPALRAFAHRDFRLFFAGQLISLVGTWMQTVAQSWLVYRLTGSAVLLGLIGFAGQFPIFLLAPAGGSLADIAEPASDHPGDAGGVDGPGPDPGRADADRPRPDLAPLRPGGAPGRGQRVRHPGPPGVPVRPGGPGRPDECDRAELLDVPRRAGGRAGGRGAAGGGGRRGVVLPAQRPELPGGPGRPAPDAPAAAGRPAERLGAGADDRGLRLRRADGADPRPAVAPGAGEPGRDALRGADADLRRPDPARRRPGPGPADGGLGARGAAGGPGPGGAPRDPRPGALGGVGDGRLRRRA